MPGPVSPARIGRGQDVAALVDSRTERVRGARHAGDPFAGTGVDEAPGLRKRVARLRTELEFLLESNASNMVYWMERRMSGGEETRLELMRMSPFSVTTRYDASGPTSRALAR